MSDRVPKTTQIKLEVSDDLEAVYANFAVITHSASEIIIDLASVLPNSPKNRVRARVVMTPANARSLQKALAENLSNYESKYGPLPALENKEPDQDRGIGFRHS